MAIMVTVANTRHVESLRGAGDLDSEVGRKDVGHRRCLSSATRLGTDPLAHAVVDAHLYQGTDGRRDFTPLEKPHGFTPETVQRIGG